MGMKAVILAGGYGTRLRPLTYTTPKPMIPIGGKPLLYYTIESLKKAGFNEIIITTGYMKEKIIEYFGNGENFGVKIYYSIEDKPLGTAGSIKLVAENLDEPFGLTQGDIVTEIDLGQQMDYHMKKGGIATIAFKEVEDPWNYGIAQLNEEKLVVRFAEKLPKEKCFSNLANLGLYTLQPEVLEYIPEEKEYDFSKNLFPKLLNLGKRIYGYVASGFWIDVGRIEGYLRANEWILNSIGGRKSESVDIGNAKIIGPVMLKENVEIKDDVKIIGPVLIEENVEIGREAEIGPNTIIHRDVEVHRKTRIGNTIIFRETQVGYRSKIRRSVIAEGCVLEAETAIEDYSIIGPNCYVGGKTQIREHSRIWPNLIIPPESIIVGDIKVPLGDENEV